MRNKLLIFVLGIFLLSFVSSANSVTLDLPVQDASISGSTYVLSASVDTNTFNLTSANFFYDDGSTNTSIGTTANDSLTQFNLTWDTTALVDVNNYIIYVNVSNETGQVTIDSSTGVDIDNGNPTASFSSSTFASESEVGLDSTFTVGLSADSTIGISSCKVYYVNILTSASQTQSVSASGNACSTSTTPTSQSLTSTDSYNVYMEATDGNGDATNSSARILRIPSISGGSSGRVPSTDTSDKGTSSPSSGFVQSIIDSIKSLWDKIAFWKK